MSDLHAQLSKALAKGHERTITNLHSDTRFAEIERNTPAAVLIAVTERGDLMQRSDRSDKNDLMQRSDRPNKNSTPGMILTQRPNTMRDHPGQVAFPGGKLEPGENAIEAALREAEEELALSPADVRIIGTTDPYQTGTGFNVTPVLATIPPDLPLVPDPGEVEAWFEAPLPLLLDQNSWVERSAIWKGAERRYLDMDYEGFRIWGVTAAIIANLSLRIGDPLNGK